MHPTQSDTNMEERYMTADVKFTAATDADAAAIIGLRHRIWGTTYRGIYPDQMLDDFAWD